MAITISTPGLHHIALRTTDIARSRKFYVDLLGFPVLLDAPTIFIVGIGNFGLAVKGGDPETKPADVFSPFRVGLDHIALTATDPKEIDRVAALLKSNGVWTEGPKTDPTLGKYYVAFKDPDGIKLEFYMA